MVPPEANNRPQPDPAATMLRRARLEQSHVVVATLAALARVHVELLTDGQPRRALRLGSHAAATFSEQLADRLEDGVEWCAHPDRDVAAWRVGHPTLVCASCLIETLDASGRHKAGTRCEVCGATDPDAVSWLALGPIVVGGLFCLPCAGARGVRRSRLLRRTTDAENRIRRTLAGGFAELEPAAVLAMQARLLRQVSSIAGAFAPTTQEAAQ